jgi:1,4-dihydroxy-6-naphthoate synthase
MSKKIIKIAHSPDSDDAFMFYAIKHKKIDLGDFEFEFSADEIAILNQKAIDNDPDLDVLAVSFHALAHIQESYSYLNSGASMAGSDYGPRLIAKKPIDWTKSSKDLKIAIPGKYTSAYLVLRLYEALKGAWIPGYKINLEQIENSIDSFKAVFCSYDEVFGLIDSGEVSAGLVIHEAQLRFKDLGYHLVVDLGQWWFQKTQGLKMPLGTNAIKKSLGEETIQKIDNLLKQSILWGLDNLNEVLAYSRNFSQNQLDDKSAKQYIDMYVNDSTIELSNNDKKSVEILLGLVK